MSDRVRIEIDCDAGSASADCDMLQSVQIGVQAETTKASIIAQILMPQIAQYMRMSKLDLMARHVAMLKDGSSES